MELRPASLADGLGQRGNDLRAEDDLDRQVGLVLGHRAVENALGRRPGLVAIEADKVGVSESVRELARPVGAEVAVQDCVAVGDRRVVHSVDDGGSDEFVVLPAGVAGLDRGYR